MALAACNTKEANPPEQKIGVGLRRIADCDDLRAEVEGTVLEALIQSRYGYRGGIYMPGMEDGGPTSGDSAGGGGGNGAPEAPTDFTGTNNQEAGVDELDLVKTDGNFLYIAQDRGIQIVKSWPADESSLVGQLELEGWAQGLFLVGDKLIVFSSIDDSRGDIDGDPNTYFYGTRLSVIDVSDRANPTVERNIDVSGYTADARLVDGKVYYALNQYLDLPAGAWDLANRTDIGLPDYPAYDAPQEDWDAAEATARTVLTPYVHDLLAGTNLDAYLPQWRKDESGSFEAMYACNDIYVPQQETPLAMLAVGSLDPATGDVGSTGLMSQGWTIYASQSSLYVAQTSYWWWGWAADFGETAIHKFALGGSEPTYAGTGEVNGYIYDQFAMSEFNGDLRVVTTDLINWGGGGVATGGDGTVSDVPSTGGGTSSGSSDGSTGSGGASGEPAPTEGTDTDVSDIEEPVVPANNVYVLRDDGEGKLNQVGHLGGIAPGETVQAVRMMGDKGFVVTFRQTDPLFTLDLSDPTDPKQVGELVMPGYSAYLHPIDEGHLLAVGMAGLETGELTGLAVNIFDVTDMANPTLLHSYDLTADAAGQNGWSWSYSEALWDHHAFTYGRDVLTIPAFTQTWDEVTQTYSGFSGTISLKATVADGISELGRVDHESLVDQSECLYDWWWAATDVVDGGGTGTDTGVATDPGVPADGGVSEPGSPGGAFSYCDWDYGYWYAQVRRSVYVEDNLYTISDYGVKVNDLNNPATEIATVVFYPEVP
jgi:uncharacterized secreted protein with C-terminal beta-propeller domain